MVRLEWWSPFKSPFFVVEFFYVTIKSTGKSDALLPLLLLERLGIQSSSSFVKICYVCVREFKGNFFFFTGLHGLVFYLEIIGS